MAIRQAIIEEIELLSSPSMQLKYEENVPFANIPAELVSGFTDLYHPKDAEFLAAFTSDELRNIAHLYGLVCEASRDLPAKTMELQKVPEWRRVIALAKELSAYFERYV